MKNRKASLLIIIISLFLLAGCGKGEIIDLSLRETVDLTLPLVEVADGQGESEDVILGELHTVYSFQTIQELNYYVYIPGNVSSSTPIMLFLHGNGDTDKNMEEVMGRYLFLRHLRDGIWNPDFILIMPINTKPSDWDNQTNNIGVIISEVINTYGGDMSNMYISGASAGADGLNDVAKAFNFNGAIFMAGNINGGYMSADDVLELWRNKPVYYYRDNLMTNGGYGYNKNLLNDITARADDYGVAFSATDLNWEHTAGLVDATFLPEDFLDTSGQYCHNGINKLIYGY